MKEYPLFNLDIPKMGHIILFKGDDSFFCRQIIKEQLKRGFSQKNAIYTHCAISGGGQQIVEVAWPKIKVIDMRDKFAGRYIIILRYKDGTPRKDAKVAFWASSNCNLGYDWQGVLWFKIKWLFKHSKQLYFCSENSLWAFQKEYQKMLNYLKPHQCLPANFLSSDQLEIVWRGVIPAE